MRRTLSAAAVTAAALTLAGCQSTAIKTTPANTSGAPAAHTSSKDAPAAAPAKKAGVGSAIDLKGDNGDAIQVTLVKIVDPAKSANEYITPDTGKRYVAVQLRIVNKGSTVYDDDPQAEAKAKDALGESFDVDFADTTAGVSMDSGLKLAPGDTALGFVTFQVPAGQKVTQVQYSAGLFGGDVAQWMAG
jgi:hypothetical protein